MQRHRSDGMALLDAAGVALSRRATSWSSWTWPMSGQTHTVAVPLPVTVTDGVRPRRRAEIARPSMPPIRPPTGAFCPAGVRRVMNLRTAVIGRRPKFDLSTLAPEPGGSIEASLRTDRAQGAFRRRLARDGDLRPPDPAGGRGDRRPCHSGAARHHVLIEPGLTGRVDAFGNVIITAGGGLR